MNMSGSPEERSRTSPPEGEATGIEREKEHERALDEIAEQLLRDCIKHDEGNNGIIMKVPHDILAPELIELARASDVDLDENRALKILKVYISGRGKEEFRMHKLAYDALQQDPDKEALIPKPLFYRDIQLSEEVRPKISKAVGRKMERVEVILMEFIDGRDLAGLLAREAVRIKDPNITDEEMKDWTFEKCMDSANIPGYANPGGKGATEAERAYEREKIENENAARLYQYLHENGVRIDPTILERMQRTIDRLHGVKIVHRDAHERNFMVTGDFKYSDDPERQNVVYLIDFGSASTFEGRYEGRQTEHYVDEIAGSRRPQDEVVLRRLEVLTQECVRESALERQQREEGKKLLTEITIIRRHPSEIADRVKFMDRRDVNRPFNPETVDSIFKFYFVNTKNPDRNGYKEGNWKKFLDYMATFIEQGLMTGDEAVEQFVKIIEKNSRMMDRAFSTRLINLGQALRFLEREQKNERHDT
ncbi:MAG: hypothetical protein ABH846_02160 [Patescibacteria group bacterium]